MGSPNPDGPALTVGRAARKVEAFAGCLDPVVLRQFFPVDETTRPHNFLSRRSPQARAERHRLVAEGCPPSSLVEGLCHRSLGRRPRNREEESLCLLWPKAIVIVAWVNGPGMRGHARPLFG
jgi:hypothetical protein